MRCGGEEELLLKRKGLAEIYFFSDCDFADDVSSDWIPL
jgi:hypothetical protein